MTRNLTELRLDVQKIRNTNREVSQTRYVNSLRQSNLSMDHRQVREHQQFQRR